MNIKKLRELLPGFAISMDNDTLRVAKKLGDDSTWREFTLSKYKNEEELASVIKSS